MSFFKSNPVTRGSSASSAPSISTSAVAGATLYGWVPVGEAPPQDMIPDAQLTLPAGARVPNGFQLTTSDTLFTHLNSAAALLAGAKIGGAKSGKSLKGAPRAREHNSAVSNDGMMPWLKQPSTRSVEIRTVETAVASSFITSAGIPTFASLAFTIGSITDLIAYTALFDQYRIELIEVLIEPSVTEVTTSATDVGELLSVVDIDDANTPTSLGDLGSYTSVVQSKGTLAHYHRWVPSVAVAVYSGAFTSFASTTSMWLDCGSTGIQHYGLKAGTSASSQAQTYFVQSRMHIAWRARH